MTAKLSNQEKLALMMTSARSQRNLAVWLGVSHQKVGRWLREGESKGVREIPKEATRTIDNAFQIHKDISKEQAEINKVPYLANTPIFPDQLPPRRDGKPSDRVFVPGTQFIRGDLRVKIMEQAAKSKKFMSTTIESTIEIEAYIEEIALREMSEGKYKGKSLNWVKNHLRKVLIENGTIRVIGGTTKLRLFTKRAPLGPIWVDGKPKWDDPYLAAVDVENELQRRHAPSANQPGGTLASSFIFQLAPKLTQPSTTNAKPTRKKWTNKRGK